MRQAVSRDAIFYNSKESKSISLRKRILKSWELYLFVLPALSYFIIFHYFPLYGLQIAFKDYVGSKGIWGSPWVGLEHFKRFFNSFYFGNVIKNTIGISLYSLIVGFPVPIILALSINELKNGFYKKTIQTVTYAPHFISVVVMSGMIISFLSPTSGIVNTVIKLFGGKPLAFMMEPGWFKSIFVLSEIWQHAGWGTIIYLSSLTGIDPQQHEAATMDGATRLQKIWHINVPGILPTMIIMLILDSGKIMSVGFEKVFLLQNAANLGVSEVISTYVYKSGLIQAQYSFSTAVGFFNSLVNCILLVIVNKIAKRAGETSLW